MKITNITNQLRDFAHDELLSLANWCQSEATKRNPVYIAEQKRQAEFWAERERLAKEKEVHSEKVTKALKAMLKPGMTLKMKGCKDGAGIREFIRWDDNDNLVCWQIRMTRQRVANGYSRSQERTNQVTTHFPDKVQRVFVNGTGLQIKSILK